MKILIIEDEGSLFKVLQEKLESENFKVDYLVKTQHPINEVIEKIDKYILKA